MAAVIAALLFYCPDCQSAPNEPCRESGRPVATHRERTRKAAREMRARRQAGADLFTPEPAPAPDPNVEWAHYKTLYAEREAAQERAAYQAEQDWEDRYSPEDQAEWARIEADAENGWLRAAENNDRYAWEDEHDRMRAALYGAAY